MCSKVPDKLAAKKLSLPKEPVACNLRLTVLFVRHSHSTVLLMLFALSLSALPRSQLSTLPRYLATRSSLPTAPPAHRRFLAFSSLPSTFLALVRSELISANIEPPVHALVHRAFIVYYQRSLSLHLATAMHWHRNDIN